MKKIIFTLSLLVAVAGVALISASPTFASSESTLEFPVVASLESGDLIKSASSSAVYYFGEDEMRYGFPNENTFMTWYDDFDDVQTISVSEMNMIPLGGMVTYHPQIGSGLTTRLIKSQSNPDVYVPMSGGLLVPLLTEEVAAVNFGEDWVDFVDDLPDSFFSYYTVADYYVVDFFTGEDLGMAYTDISIYLGLSSATGVMMYQEPLRFAAEDESVELEEDGEHCANDYCAYNILTVEQGSTLKFVNYTEENLTIREENNLFSTGAMETEDIVVITIDLEPGQYNFAADQDEEMIGVLIVE